VQIVKGKFHDKEWLIRKLQTASGEAFQAVEVLNICNLWEIHVHVGHTLDSVVEEEYSCNDFLLLLNSSISKERPPCFLWRVAEQQTH
jgi:hypothetical protein